MLKSHVIYVFASFFLFQTEDYTGEDEKNTDLRLNYSWFSIFRNTIPKLLNKYKLCNKPNHNFGPSE